jgi:hypothetical protein
MDQNELERRTLEFSKNIISVIQKLPKNLIISCQVSLLILQQV